MYGQFYILSRTAIVRVLVKMCQDCNTTIFIFAVFVVSLSLTPSVKCSVFYINIECLIFVYRYEPWCSIKGMHGWDARYDSMKVSMLTRLPLSI